MRDQIVAALRGELHAQAEAERAGEHPAGAPYVRLDSYRGEAFVLIDGHVDVHRLADAVLLALANAAPPGGLLQVGRAVFSRPEDPAPRSGTPLFADERLREQLDRLEAIADRIEGAMTVEVEDPRQLILEAAGPLTEEQFHRIKQDVRALAKGDRCGPLLVEGMRVRGAIKPPLVVEAGGLMTAEDLEARLTQLRDALREKPARSAVEDAINEARKESPLAAFAEPVPVTPAERETLKWVRGFGEVYSESPRVMSPHEVELAELVKRGLLDVRTEGETNDRHVWTVTPLGLRAIEEEPL